MDAIVDIPARVEQQVVVVVAHVVAYELVLELEECGARNFIFTEARPGAELPGVEQRPSHCDILQELRARPIVNEEPVPLYPRTQPSAATQVAESAASAV